MAKLGSNVRCVAAHEHRDAIATLFSRVFEAEALHPNPTLDVYLLADGSRVGVSFVEPEQALTPAQHEVAGTWLELVVPDAAAAREAIIGLGHAPLKYQDREHSYFRMPGGQVYRIAAR
jgi:hypothetical protein